MKRCLFLLQVFILMLATSAYAQKNERFDYQESSARNLEPQHTMLLTPLVADLVVSPTKVKHVEKAAFSSYIVDKDVAKYVPGFKKIALSRAAHAHDADVMVGTTIDVDTDSDGHIVITVSGYPAHYKNFRIGTQEELRAIMLARSIAAGNDNRDVIDRAQTHTDKEVIIK